MWLNYWKRVLFGVQFLNFSFFIIITFLPHLKSQLPCTETKCLRFSHIHLANLLAKVSGVSLGNFKTDQLLDKFWQKPNETAANSLKKPLEIQQQRESNQHCSWDSFYYQPELFYHNIFPLKDAWKKQNKNKTQSPSLRWHHLSLCFTLDCCGKDLQKQQST